MIREALILVSLAAAVCPVRIALGQASHTAQGASFDQLLASAENARDENRDDDAIPLFRRALTEKPDSEECLWYLGSTLYAKEQYAEALRCSAAVHDHPSRCRPGMGAARHQ